MRPDSGRIELLEQLSAAKSLPPGCFGVSGNVAKEAAALIEELAALLDEAEGWLAINSTVNHDELCSRIRATLSKAHHTGG